MNSKLDFSVLIVGALLGAWVLFSALTNSKPAEPAKPASPSNPTPAPTPPPSPQPSPKKPNSPRPRPCPAEDIGHPFGLN